MARRKHRSEQELPFVALMDTMTNVVGVLTIVLVMIGISLARAANRVFSALPPATEEQIQAAQSSVDRLRAEQAACQDKLKTQAKPAPSPAQLATLDTELAKLERTMKEQGIKLIDIDALNRERTRREAELKQKKTEMDQKMSEEDKLKALLDKTPIVQPKAAKVVRIPASRPIPEGANVEHIIVTKDSIHWIDVDAAKAAFLNDFKWGARSGICDWVKRGKQSIPIYDQTKLTRYFEGRKLPFREFRIDISFVGWSSSPVIKLIPKTASPATFQSTLQNLKTTPKTVIMFHVTSDGFENYIAAREICDKVGIPAGWELSGSPEYQIHVPEIETNHQKDPPKPGPKPDPKTEIKPPARKLD